jgi:uncharacterized membrane protein
MSDPTQLPQGEVELYLAKLRKALAGLPADDVEEILRELRGHIAERAAETDSEQHTTPLERILRQLGTPEHIGSLYRADALVARARATFSPVLIVRTAIRWAGRTVGGFAAFVLGMTGYALGLSLIVCALLKPFLPTHIGLWVSRHGLQLGYTTAIPQAREWLGWWIIPFGLIVGAAFILGTTAFLRWTLRFVPRASRRVASCA